MFEFIAPVVGPGGLILYICTDSPNSGLSVAGKYLVVQDITATKAVLA